MDDQMVEDVARAIAPYSFDPNRFWSALIDQTAEQAREVQQNHVRGLARDAIKATGVDDLRKALEAAQDEIEARILASERDRELIRQLGVVVDHMAPAAYKAIMAAGGVV